MLSTLARDFGGEGVGDRRRAGAELVVFRGLDSRRSTVEDAGMPESTPDATSPATLPEREDPASNGAVSDRGVEVDRERAIARAIEVLARLGVMPTEAAHRLQRAWILDLAPDDFIPTVQGKRHYCGCGVGVFKSPRSHPLVFVCNGCGDVWRGTR